MLSVKKNSSLLNFIALGIITLLPLIFIFRSASVNLATIILSFIILYFLASKKINTGNLFKNLTLKYLFFFLLFIFLNSLYHQQSLLLVAKSIGNFRYLLLTIAVFYILENTDEYWIKILIYFNAILITLISLDIIYQYIFYENIFGFKPGMCPKGILEGCDRFSGIFNDEWIAGGYLAQIGLLFLILIFSLKFISKKYNILLFFSMMLLFLTIILTGERNATLIFILSIFFFLIFNRNFKKLAYVLIFSISIIIFLGNFSKSIESRFINPLKSLNQYSLTQLYNKLQTSPWGNHYNAAVELFLEKPVLGHGPKSFRNVCNNTLIEKNLKDRESLYSSCSTHPHNYLLEFMSENGLVGGLFYIGFILIILFQILNFDPKTKFKNLSSLAIASLILAILFPFKPSGSFFSTFNATMFFYILGFYLHYKSQDLNKI